MIIGIDPGISGAVAVALMSGRAFSVHDMPTVTTATKSRKAREIDAAGLAALLRSMDLNAIDFVVVERMRSMPRRPAGHDGGAFHGGLADFSLGDAKGVIRGVCAALGLSVQYVEPQRWKKHAGLLKADKDASRCKALELWPSMADMLKLKKHHGRAEALLIARFGALVLNAQFEPRLESRNTVSNIPL